MRAVKSHQRGNLIEHLSFVQGNTSWLVHAYLVYVRPFPSIAPLLGHYLGWNKIRTKQNEYNDASIIKRLPGFKHVSYTVTDWCSSMCLQSRVASFTRGFEYMCYKLSFGNVECKRSGFFALNSSAVARGHVYNCITIRILASENSFYWAYFK